eukprot:Nk52_evm9s248 gene=Nk52_evmTU9s248
MTDPDFKPEGVYDCSYSGSNDKEKLEDDSQEAPDFDVEKQEVTGGCSNDENTHLFALRLGNVPVKSFHSEIRLRKDLQNFVGALNVGSSCKIRDSKGSSLRLDSRRGSEVSLSSAARVEPSLFAYTILDLNEVSGSRVIEKMLQKIVALSEGAFSQEVAKLCLEEIIVDGPGAFAQSILGVVADTGHVESRVTHRKKSIRMSKEDGAGGNSLKLKSKSAFLSGDELPFVVVFCDSGMVNSSYVGVCRLMRSINLSETHSVKYVILVVTPIKVKETKKAFEIGRSFATLFADNEFRFDMNNAGSEDAVKACIEKYLVKMREKAEKKPIESIKKNEKKPYFEFMKGIVRDIRRRIPHYTSDYVDGFIGEGTLRKTLATIAFLYFAVMLPAIAFGVLDYGNTGGLIGVEQVFYSQTIAGVAFALLGGQPMIVLLSTAPLSLYIKVIYNVALDNDISFTSLYAWVGIWNMIFLVLYAFSGISSLMRLSTQGSEEAFALFISVAFTYDSVKALVEEFEDNYCGGADCNRDSAMLYLFLLLATVFIGLFLYGFRKSVLLSRTARDFISMYSLPISVLFMSFVGSYLFRDIESTQFQYSDRAAMSWANPGDLPVKWVFAAMPMGFSLSLLFFMDQNISAALVNAPDMKLKKGPAYHLDILVIGVINGFLSLYGLPWVHAALPHSPLHCRNMADVEEIMHNGKIQERIVRARETRITALFSSALIGVSILMLPKPLQYLPQPVLYGIFLYLAITALESFDLWERISLVFTQQSHYPPSHYFRKMDQKTVHKFTLVQLICVLVLCIVGFAPSDYLQMSLPVFIVLLLPARHWVAPKIFSQGELEILDPEADIDI